MVKCILLSVLTIPNVAPSPPIGGGEVGITGSMGDVASTKEQNHCMLCHGIFNRPLIGYGVSTYRGEG